MRARPYQTDALNAITEEWKTHKATLAVMATGLGKTILMAKMVQRLFPRKVLIVVHRRELAEQAQGKVVKSTGFNAEIEMGDDMVQMNQRYIGGYLPQVVVASVQSLASSSSGRFRMSKFNPMEFGAVFCDEAHHTPSKQWRHVIDYFTSGNPNLRVLGVTATPKRADQKALGMIFDSVACNYDIEFGIQDGWLVPVRQQIVTVTDIDLSHVKSRAGDFSQDELAEVMEREKVLHGVVGPTLEIAEDRKTLVFTASVEQARNIAEIFNRHRPDSADWVSGETPKPTRQAIVQKFRDGKLQFLCNCNVFTEGFDDWGIEVVAMAKPTKSWISYCQMVGRALRPQEGLVDLYTEPADRREAIETSLKPNALILDFEGNSGRHHLICTADILGGKYSEPVIALARRKMKEKQLDTLQALEEAQQEQEKKDKLQRILDQTKAKKNEQIKARAKYVLDSVDPFDTLRVQVNRQSTGGAYDDNRRLSKKQAGILKRNGIDPEKYSYGEAAALVAEICRRYRHGLATYSQSIILRKFGYDTNVKRDEASRLLSLHLIKGARVS